MYHSLTPVWPFGEVEVPGKAGEPHDDAKDVADAEAVDRGNEVRGTGSRSYDQVCHGRKMDIIIHTVYIYIDIYIYE